VEDAGAASIGRGSRGDVVRQVQSRLKEWGYYNGSVDGIFGSGTEASVKSFQRTNGLTPDGKVGAKTLNELGLGRLSNSSQGGGSQGSGSQGGNSGSQSDSNDVKLLARLISAESRGEPYNGQVAVGAVVLNRMKHPSFPNTMSGVIYQSGAFTCISDGQFNQPVQDSCYQAARDALNGQDPSGGAIYYFNPATATSQWIWSRPLIVVIGKHRFCA
jgi:N-acetylmuramoyl-L-alanine amidase